MQLNIKENITKKINKWIRSHKSKIKNEHIYNDWLIYKKRWLKLKFFIVHSLVNLAIVCLYFTPCLAHKKWKLMLFYHLLSRVRLSACHFSHPHPYVLGFFFLLQSLRAYFSQNWHNALLRRESLNFLEIKSYVYFSLR